MEETRKYFKCITNKYGKFKLDKVYEARALYYRILDKSPTEFKITDEDGDYYTIELDRNLKQRRMFTEVYSEQ